MTSIAPPLVPSHSTAARERRACLVRALPSQPALLSAGTAPGRNYPANGYRFRASSHFLYFTGLAIEGALLWLDGDDQRLLLPPHGPTDALWHGPRLSDAALAEATGLRVGAISDLAGLRKGRPAATLRPTRLDDACTLADALGRELSALGAQAADLALADAVIALRLVHDAAAITGLECAADATVAAHLAGMAFTRPGVRGYQVCATMEHALALRGCGTAYGSIVTTRGEVLHNHDYQDTLAAGDLLLADVGGETEHGYAGDVTRTWPVSGRFSPTQRDVYQAVLSAQAAAIAMLQPGVRYRDVHLRAARVLTGHLVDLGILVGDPDALVEDGVHALFMPHGIGHLLGLDVHDMEDLGDRAGYAEGRTRSAQFGLGYLRLDRDLCAGMAVTIEPGFYQVPALLADPARFGIDPRPLQRDRLAMFADVRGIRVEDDVLITETSCRVLSEALPKQLSDVEACVARTTA